MTTPTLLRRSLRATPLIAGLVLSAASAQSGSGPDQVELMRAGEQLYQSRCATCHNDPTGRIPPRAMLERIDPRNIMLAMEIGAMRSMAEGMSHEDMTAVATWLTGVHPEPQWQQPELHRCSHEGGPVTLAKTDWPSVGLDDAGSRYQPLPGLTAEELPRLRLKWAFALAKGAPGGPVVAGDRVFLASGDGQVHALDADTGCSHWSVATDRTVRMVTVAPLAGPDSDVAVFFGDDQARVTALDAQSGEQLWQTEPLEAHPLRRITAPPSVLDGRVYVPLSSMEDPRTHDPNYECCTFRGGVAALDARTGELLWKTHTIAEEPAPATPVDGVARFAPAGAAVFTPLGLDARRGRVYVPTAESYTELDSPGAYSVIALDMATGERLWEQQFLPDAERRQQVCTEEVLYSDCRNIFSMSTQVMLHRLPDGRDVLLAGQKWGQVYALDPDHQGRLLWSRQISPGGDLGGVMYGLAADSSQVYAAISDVDFSGEAEAPTPGGLVALDLATGKVNWQAPPQQARCSWGERSCSSAQVSAPAAMPGVVFSGAWDGHMRAYDSESGEVLWSVDTARPVDGVNGVPVEGGRLGGYPLVVRDGRLYIVSGSNTVERPGNALLVYSLDGD